MAARTRRIQHTDEVRKRIQTSQLVNRLTSHALGKVKMEATQVQAARVLLGKTLPDLQSVEHSTDPQKPVMVVQVDGEQYASIAKRLLKEV